MRNAKHKPKRQSATRATKVQLRLRPAEKVLLARAAKIRRTTLSTFLLEHALQGAQQVLPDQVHTALPPERWKAFCKALDAPPRPIPSLKKLLREESVFDGHGNAAN